MDAEASAEALAGRASVHNKLKNFMEAAADASRALEMDDTLAAAHKEKGCASSACDCHACPVCCIARFWVLLGALRGSGCCSAVGHTRAPAPAPPSHGLHLRRCCRNACYNLEEFESAMDAFEAAAALEPTKSIHKTWVNMCKVQLGGERELPSAGSCYEWPVAVCLRAHAVASLAWLRAEQLPPTPINIHPGPVGEAPPEERASTSGSGQPGAGGGAGTITLQGDQLQAFLAQSQQGKLAAALGGGGGAGGAPREAPEEPGSERPTHVTVDDPEFSKYWKAPIAGKSPGATQRQRCLCCARSGVCMVGHVMHGWLKRLLPCPPIASLPIPACSLGGRQPARQAAGRQVPPPVVPEPATRGGELARRWIPLAGCKHQADPTRLSCDGLLSMMSVAASRGRSPPALSQVDVLAKGLKKEQVGVTIEPRRLRVVTISAEGGRHAAGPVLGRGAVQRSRSAAAVTVPNSLGAAASPPQSSPAPAPFQPQSLRLLLNHPCRPGGV